MPLRMGRPGLVGTMARTAVVAGTASATANAVNGRARRKAMEQQAAFTQEQAAAAPPQPPAESDLASQLTELKGLVDSGVLTQDEFEAKKKEMLGI